jgi:hypothetical protein
VYKHINKCKIKGGNRGQERELTGRSILRRRRTELDCSAIEEEEEEGGGGGEEEKEEEEEEEKKKK